MRILKSSLYVTLWITIVSSTGYSFKQGEMPEFNAWHLTTYTIDQTEFPMIPEEKNIKDFPSPIAEDEEDPQALEKYYEAVATAYRRQAEEQKNIVKSYTVRLQGQQDQLFVDRIRSSKSSQSLKIDAFSKARASSAHYYKKTYIPSDFNAQLFFQKADFYQEIADYWKTVKES